MKTNAGKRAFISAGNPPEAIQALGAFIDALTPERVPDKVPHRPVIRVPFLLGLLVLCAIASTGMRAAADTTAPIYGAPYVIYDTYLGTFTGDTVDGVLAKYKPRLLRAWYIYPYGPWHCTFKVWYLGDGSTTGRFASFGLRGGGCGGGGYVYGTKLTHPTSVAITPVLPARIPYMSLVSDGHVFTDVLLNEKVTKNGEPVSGVSVPLQSNRGNEDTIFDGSLTTDDGTVVGAEVYTRDQPGTSTITSASPEIRTSQPGVISWLPARYDHNFWITCYVVVPESEFSSPPDVPVNGIPGLTLPKIFLTNVELNGSGRTTDGRFIHWKGKGKYGWEPCAKTYTNTCAERGRTVAVDPAVIPLSSHIEIDTRGARHAEDTGGGIGLYHIDDFWGEDYDGCVHEWGGSRHSGVTFLDYGN